MLRLEVTQRGGPALFSNPNTNCVGMSFLISQPVNRNGVGIHFAPCAKWAQRVALQYSQTPMPTVLVFAIRFSVKVRITGLLPPSARKRPKGVALQCINPYNNTVGFCFLSGLRQSTRIEAGFISHQVRNGPKGVALQTWLPLINFVD